MAALPRAVIEEYTRQLNMLSDGMKAAMADELQRIDWSDMSAARRQTIAIVQRYCSASSDAATVLANAFYETVRNYAGVSSKFTPLYESGYIPEATETAVADFFEAKGATPATIQSKCTSRLGYEVRRAAGNSVINNGARDKAKPRYARVPSGSETCAFCMMLASRGFVYSKEGANAHYHDNCDCRIVPGFNGVTEVEGYDPAECYDRWQEMLEEQAEARAKRSGESEGSAKKEIVEALTEPLK